MLISKELQNMLSTLLPKTFFKRPGGAAAGLSTDTDNRRINKRHSVRRYNGNINYDGLSYQFRLKNLSCTGASGLTAAPIAGGQTVRIELIKGVLQPAIVRWTRGTSVGLSFRHPLPMYIVSAILEADQRHCRAANDWDLNASPLAGVELGIVKCLSQGSDESGEDAQASYDITYPGSEARDSTDIDDREVGWQELAEDRVDRSCESSKRRVEPRMRTLLRVAKLISRNDSGLCCLRSISDSCIMAETGLVLKLGEKVQFELSDRHRLCGRVVWRNEAGVGIALDESIDSVRLLNQLAQDGAQGRSRPPRLSIAKRAIAYSEAGIHNLLVVDISQKGMKVRHSGDLTSGLAIKVCLENGFEKRAIVRWSRAETAGLEFRTIISYEDLNCISDF